MCTQLTFHAIPEETISRINAAQRQGKAPSVDMIQDPAFTRLVDRFKLADELFPTKDPQPGVDEHKAAEQ